MRLALAVMRLLSLARAPWRRVVALSAAACGLCLIGAAPAYAYLDPGTGSVLLQLVLGGGAGIAVAVGVYWRKLKEMFGGRPPRPISARIEPK